MRSRALHLHRPFFTLANCRLPTISYACDWVANIKKTETSTSWFIVSKTGTSNKSATTYRKNIETVI